MDGDNRADAMAETASPAKRERDLTLPIIWGVAAGLFVAVVMRGLLAGGLILLLALLAFGTIVLSAGGLPRLRRRRRAPVSAAPRRSAPRPPSAMLAAAVGDDLTRIRGVDGRTAAALKALGVRRYSQIAAWTPDEAARMDATLGGTKAVLREDWIGQAGHLALGGPAATGSDAPAKQG
jgi:predicted flap endonuclease-1-like 5' DNA nuclease